MEFHLDCTTWAQEAAVIDVNGDKLYDSHYDFMDPLEKTIFIDMESMWQRTFFILTLYPLLQLYAVK